MAVEGQRVGHVDLRGVPLKGDKSKKQMCFCNCLEFQSKLDLLPLSVDVLDEAVRNAVPGEGLVSRLPKDGVVAEMSCSVDHLDI